MGIGMAYDLLFNSFFMYLSYHEAKLLKRTPVEKCIRYFISCTDYVSSLVRIIITWTVRYSID